MDILYLSGYDYWDFIWFRPQQVASRLARGHRLLYIQPTRAKKWKQPWLWLKMRKDGDNLTVFYPIVLPGINRFRWLRRLNQAILSLCIRIILKRFEFRDFVCIIGTPFMGEFAKKFGERLTIYDVNDDWASIPNLSSEFLREEENKLLEKADIVFATSEPLVEEKRDRCREIVLAPSAADTEIFEKAFLDAADCPPDMSQIPAPRIGVVGSFNNTKDDFGLLDYIAERKSEWSLVLIGPVMDDINLDDYPHLKAGAYFLGKKDYLRLPEYIHSLDVCILPYQDNSFTRYANPTKILEYLACGKPVVATAIPGVRCFEEAISIAEDREDFIGRIEEAIQTVSDEDLSARRRDFSRTHTWEKLVRDMLQRINTRVEEYTHV